MDFLKKIPPLWLKIYRPVIYILTLVLVWMGAVNNNKLNLNVADSTGGAFDTIENLGEIRKGTLHEYEQKLEQRTKDGDASQAEIEDLKAIIDDLKHNEKGVVLICFDFDAGCDAEMTPQVATILRHCFSRGVKVLINTGGNVMSQPLAQQTINKAAKDGSRIDPPYPTMESGVDYVFLGFRPNAFQLYLQMGESIISAYETDYSGKDLSTMPIMEHIRDFRAIDCVVTVSAYVGAPETWINDGELVLRGLWQHQHVVWRMIKHEVPAAPPQVFVAVREYALKAVDTAHRDGVAVAQQEVRMEATAKLEWLRAGVLRLQEEV